MKRYSEPFSKLSTAAKQKAIEETREDHDLSSLMSDDDVITYIEEIGMYFDEEGSRND